MDERARRAGARAVPVPDDPDVDGPLDYRDATAVAVPPGDDRPPEAWLRTVFEGAPRPLRIVLRVAWRVGLGLRLGPSGSPDHILGWTIAARSEHAVRVTARSPLLTAVLVLRLAGGDAVMTTNVRYRRRLAAPVWAAARPIHRRIVPWLLDRAAAHP
jgi:hypothetical protein